MKNELTEKLHAFFENEARSCSMEQLWFTIHG